MHRELDANWQTDPEGPRARPERVDIWRLDLVDLAAQQPRRGHQPSALRTRTGPIQPDIRAAAHHARRQILGRYLDRDAESLVIGLHPGGKPMLESPDRALEFNLSHSRDVGLLAVTIGAHVGIDIELERRHIEDPLRIARRVMSSAEVDLLAGLAATARRRAFFDLWTRLEARQKALGRGIFEEPVSTDSLSLFSFRPEAAHAACLAVSPVMTQPQIRFFHYSAR